MRHDLLLLIFFVFSSFGLSAEESFLLIQGSTGKVIQEFGPHLDEQVTPACSFNIALSLMGYDIGILKDEKTPTWEFKEGYEDFSESWRASQDPTSWMARSCVWVSKLIACELGRKNMQSYLALFSYGNQDASSLKISPKEQVDFIQKMLNKKISISGYAIEMTRKLVGKGELFEGWDLYGKTGLGTLIGEDDKPLEVRWFVGWIEKGGVFFPFAYQMREKEIDLTQAVPRVKQLLKDFLKNSLIFEKYF